MMRNKSISIVFAFAFAALLAVPAMAQDDTDQTQVDFQVSQVTSVTFAVPAPFNPTWNTTGQTFNEQGAINYEDNSGNTKEITIESVDAQVGADPTGNISSLDIDVSNVSNGTGQGPVQIWDGSTVVNTPSQLISGIGTTSTGSADVIFTVDTNEAVAQTYSFTITLGIGTQ